RFVRANDAVDDPAEGEQQRREQDDHGRRQVWRDWVGGSLLQVAVDPVGGRRPQQNEVDRDQLDTRPYDGGVENLPYLVAQLLQQIVQIGASVGCSKSRASV